MQDCRYKIAVRGFVRVLLHLSSPTLQVELKIQLLKIRIEAMDKLLQVL